MRDAEALRKDAQSAMARGDLDGAIHTLLALVGRTELGDADYARGLAQLADALGRRGDARSALTATWYLAMDDADERQRAVALSKNATDVDRGRSLALAGKLRDAARVMEGAGRSATAAIYAERAGDFGGARTCWSTLAEKLPSRTQGAEAYEAALVQFNIARCSEKMNDVTRARSARVASVRLLEEAADHFESTGRRERAFDCFRVLSEIGRASGKLEDVLEGYVNAIRIVREDGLKNFALDMLDEATSEVAEAGDLAAAATLAREASEYARTLGLGDTRARHARREGMLWRSLGAERASKGAAGVAENAFASAITAFVDARQIARVGAVFGDLAALDLPPARKEHYARAAKRHADATDAHVDEPARAKRSRDATAVWHDDLVEWEEAGSAVEACAGVMLDASLPSVTRRHAMLARLTALTIEEDKEASPTALAGARARLATQLAQMQVYASLAPLESLSRTADRTVKIAALRAAGGLLFKRSFTIVRAGLADADEDVAGEAARAIEALTFRHAVDPLARVLRESGRTDARSAALRALTQIDAPEAADLLLDALAFGAPLDRAAAYEALTRPDARGRRHFAEGSPAIRASSEELRSAIREAVKAHEG